MKHAYLCDGGGISIAAWMSKVEVMGMSLFLIFGTYRADTGIRVRLHACALTTFRSNAPVYNH